jgi:hypothetical protein
MKKYCKWAAVSVNKLKTKKKIPHSFACQKNEFHFNHDFDHLECSIGCVVVQY